MAGGDAPDDAARHAEIAWRYAWQRRQKRERFGPYDRGRHRACEVSKLAMYRQRQGHGFDPKPVIEDIMTNARIWTARALGQRLKLTWAERCELGLRTMEPYDLSSSELKRKKFQRRSMLSRERSRRYRRRRKRQKEVPEKRAPQSPARSPNGERQRRYRQRKRNITGNVTRHSGVRPLEISNTASAMRIFYTSTACTVA